MLSRDLNKAQLRARAVAYPAIDRPALKRLLVLALMGLSIVALAASRSWATAQIASAARTVQSQAGSPKLLAAFGASGAVAAKAAQAPIPAPGVDVDGDGQSDFMNPTGRPEREHDAYGSGQFGVSRDGGERRHEGVDYTSVAGQAVKAPMSGFVTRVGWAYEGDSALRTVEITNPALRYVARILYVSPDVAVGQAVAMGEVIGRAQSLQRKYPGGMTNHVHLQIAPKGRAWMDCSRLIPEMRS